MKQECRCSALFIDAERKCVLKKEDEDRNKTLKSRNVKYFRLTAHYFFEKVINKNETVIMFLEIRTHHQK
jgi:alpha/beta superfamily hydrolase